MQKITLYQLRTLGVAVVHEEEAFLVLDKPSGLLVIPDRFDPTIPNLYSALRALEEQVFIVHRIDKETSGLVIFAKDPESHTKLNAQFENHLVQKKYLALCKGRTETSSDLIDLPLGENPATHRIRVDRKNGKPSQTEYRVERELRGFTFVEAVPRTGRTHQIRVHLAAVGLPIVGDPFYGDGKPFRLSEIKKNYKEGREAEKPLLSRTALHAAHLRLRHPGSDQEVEFTSDLPKDMRSSLRAIEKYG